LEGAAADPRRPLWRLPLLADAERRQLLAWGAGPPAAPRAAGLPALFDAAARRDPSREAVACGGRRLSYGELAARAGGLARRLRGAGVGAESRVGVLMGRGAGLAAAVLGVLKAGGAYVPLDPTYPAERLAYVAGDAGVEAVVSERGREGLLPEGRFNVFYLDEDGESVGSEEGQLPDPVDSGVRGDNLAYVIYTSGSTGRPKGVAMSHRSLVNLIEWQTRAAPPASDKTLQYAPFSFDVSFQEMFSTWSAGGTLVMVDEDVRRDPVSFLNYLNEAEVGRLFLPPVALQQIAEASLSQGIVPAYVREIITAGEQLKISPQVASLLARIGGCVLRNHYGPTESHVVTELVLTGDPQGWPARPPIGKPIANTQIYILDPYLQPVPTGVPGELHIGGLGVARGYLDRPGLTAQKFIPDPFSDEPGARLYKSGDLARFLPDGNVEYISRADDQVKVRGYRIEPGEVEAVLRQHPAVNETVVMARESGAGVKQLVAYVLYHSGQTCIVSELMNFLRERVPNYMIPSVFIELESLPLSPNGKIDRHALPVPDGERPKLEGALVPPRNSIEKRLAAIWRGVMGLKQVGIRDNFFDLGGHSLLATQVISRVSDTFGVQSFPLRRIFETPTIAELATAVLQYQVEEQDDEEMTQLLTELEQFSPDEVRTLLAEGADEAEGPTVGPG
jgi:amino acid adenylation domain-containing protein